MGKAPKINADDIIEGVVMPIGEYEKFQKAKAGVFSGEPADAVPQHQAEAPKTERSIAAPRDKFGRIIIGGGDEVPDNDDQGPSAQLG